MKIYLAARYGRRQEMHSLMGILGDMGCKVTARWITAKTHEMGEVTEKTRPLLAQEDLDDIRECNLLVAFTEEGSPKGASRGGRHVELGYALGIGKPIIVVGPRENIFCYLHQVRVVTDVAEFFRIVQTMLSQDLLPLGVD